MSGRKPAEKVLLLDGHSLAYRAFYALPPDLRTSSGQVTNAVYGFTGMLIKAMQDFQTEHIAVAFDMGAPAERSAIRPEYKAQRTAAPDEFRQQMGLIHEVLDTLKIPIFQIEGVEADDLIYVLGSRLAAEGKDVVIVTADRDFFQMVGPRIHVMMNRRGVSDTVIYDEAGIRERYGFGPERYLDYAALRGDPSDNIQGVPGIGEKTAAKLIQTYGTLEEMYERIDKLPPKTRERLLPERERLIENRDFFRLRSASELAAQGTDVSILEVDAQGIKTGEWDFRRIRDLFDSLEFRTHYERLAALKPGLAEVAGKGFEAETFEITDETGVRKLAEDIAGLETVGLRVGGDPLAVRRPPSYIAITTSEGAAAMAGEASFVEILAPALEGKRLVTHGSKDAIQRLELIGVSVDFYLDTEIAAYLADPARGTYGLDELSRQYLSRDLKLEAAPSEGTQQSLLDEAEPQTDVTDQCLQAVAILELAEVLEKELKNRGGWDLLADIEMPLARVLAKVEASGVKIDVPYLNEMSQRLTLELTEIEKKIYELAGEPFNIGSPPQLRKVLYDNLGLKPSKKTKTGFSTDASVLESLREEHPIVDLILRHRERSKLKSTYLDALPPLVDPETNRIHCRFNQTVASTGRLSSERPNLQNIPIRTEEGKQIRRAFIAEEGHVLLTADYSQIELRILAHLSEDPELMQAFERREDIHRLSIAKALGMDPSQVGPELRAIGKMVSYGVTYGMGPFGLSQRLKIPVDQARTYIDGFFALYPRVREYLDSVVAQATADGFTTTMLGRRRYVPELKSRNPRMRGLGERQALNAPIQGSAADVMKLAMIRADRTLSASGARMVLTVHDELVFEVPGGEAEQVALTVREAMENAVALKVPLDADIGWGRSWAEAKP